jgi:hypothetical protein
VQTIKSHLQGQIEKIGTFAELSDNGLNTLNLEPENDDQSPKEEEVKQRQRLTSIVSQTVIPSDSVFFSAKRSMFQSTVPEEDDEAEPQETQELMEKGAIPTSTYWEYYRAGGSIALFLFVLILLLVAQASCNAGDLWLTYWYVRFVCDFRRHKSYFQDKHGAIAVQHESNQ